MARGAVDKLYRSFKAGFITEATGLSYPEDSCRDIDNCDIELDGTVRRRLGLNSELNASTIGSGLYVDTFYSGLGGPDSNTDLGTTVLAEELAISYHIWRNPGNVGEYNFIVFQIGNNLVVRNYEAEPISDPMAIANIVTGAVEFVIDNASTGFIYNATKSAAAKVSLQSSSGLGRLFLTSSHTVPFYMSFDPVTEAITVNRLNVDGQYGEDITLAIRDFTGVDDDLQIDEQPEDLSDEHMYNLINQGWGSDEWNDVKGEPTNTYPSNAQQWFLGRDETGMFDADDLLRQEFGNGMAPRGHVVFDLLNGRKTAVDPDTGDSVTIEAEWEEATRGFKATAFFAQRLWLAGEENPVRPNGVYFSKVIADIRDAAVFMQVQDPASEHFPDLLATDGGVIYIPEADHIERLEPFGAGVVVFARNGAWIIYGGEGGFTATTFSVEKVSSTGIISANTVVRTEQLLAFWADNGIHALALPESGVIPVLTDLSIDKVYTFYNMINRDARRNASGTFDPISKKVFWQYLQADSYSFPAFQRFYNRMLILDTRTGAFTKYSFNNDLEGVTESPSLAFPRLSPVQAIDLTNEVLVGADEVVVGVDPVVVGAVSLTDASEFLAGIKVITLHGAVNGLFLSEFNDFDFVDHQSVTGIDAFEFISYVTTGDEILEDAQREKQTTYVHSFFKRTEQGYELDDEGEIVFRRPSGCTAQGRWDWHVTNGGKRWTTPQRAYRYRRPHVPVSVNDPLDTGEEIVYTKIKIRGHGRALTMHYESEARKDFRLLGWSAAYTANGV